MISWHFPHFFFTNSKFRSIFDAFNIIYCFIFRSVIIQIESRYIYLYSVLRISRFKSIPKKIRRQSGKNSIGKIFSEFSAVATERDFGCAQRASRRSMHVAWKHAEYLKIHIRFIILGKLWFCGGWCEPTIFLSIGHLYIHKMQSNWNSFSLKQCWYNCGSSRGVGRETAQNHHHIRRNDE